MTHPKLRTIHAAAKHPPSRPPRTLAAPHSPPKNNSPSPPTRYPPTLPNESLPPPPRPRASSHAPAKNAPAAAFHSRDAPASLSAAPKDAACGRSTTQSPAPQTTQTSPSLKRDFRAARIQACPCKNRTPPVSPDESPLHRSKIPRPFPATLARRDRISPPTRRRRPPRYPLPALPGSDP